MTLNFMRGSTVMTFLGLTLSVGAAPEGKPTLFLIGDSTVNNGTKGQCGWGQVIGGLFDTNRIQVVNRARGGRSSRTFLTEGLWSNVVSKAKAGDFVLMQFGHNDGGSLSKSYRASLKGNGGETQEITNTNNAQKEIVHTYGWYMRRYVTEAKAAGMTPVVLSLVPRNDWKDGKVCRATGSYATWAAEAAHDAGAAFVDLNAIVARHYDEMGQEQVKPLFPHEHTHTSRAGAELNARCVVEGLRQLNDCPLKDYLLPDGIPNRK